MVGGRDGLMDGADGGGGGLVQWVSVDDGYRWVGSMGECG